MLIVRCQQPGCVDESRNKIISLVCLLDNVYHTMAELCPTNVSSLEPRGGITQFEFSWLCRTHFC